MMINPTNDSQHLLEQTKREAASSKPHIVLSIWKKKEKVTAISVLKPRITSARKCLLSVSTQSTVLFDVCSLQVDNRPFLQWNYFSVHLAAHSDMKSFAVCQGSLAVEFCCMRSYSDAVLQYTHSMVERNTWAVCWRHVTMFAISQSASIRPPPTLSKKLTVPVLGNSQSYVETAWKTISEN